MSSLRAVSVLLLSLTMHSIECQSKAMCDFIKPDGSYEGLGIHKEYRLDEKGEVTGDYYMTNKRGLKWKFELSENFSQLYLLPGQSDEYEESKVKSFGIHFERPMRQPYWANCYVDKKNISEVHCIDQNGRHLTVGVFQLTSDFVIFRGYALDIYMAWYTVILNRLEKNRTYLVGESPDHNLQIYHAAKCRIKNCPKNLFIEEMNSYLLSRLDGVVDFNFVEAGEQGFLLLFNIEGRPMFCFQSEGHRLSFDCESVQNLKTVFEECFQEVSKIKGDSIDPLYWVLLFEVVLMVILAVACDKMIKVRRRRFMERPSMSDTLTSYHSSQE